MQYQQQSLGTSQPQPWHEPLATYHRTVQALTTSPQQTVPVTRGSPAGLVASNSVADQSDMQEKKLCPLVRTSVNPLYFKAFCVPASFVQGRHPMMQTMRMSTLSMVFMPTRYTGELSFSGLARNTRA